MSGFDAGKNMFFPASNPDVKDRGQRLRSYGTEPNPVNPVDPVNPVKTKLLKFRSSKLALSASLYHKMIEALNFLCNYSRKMIMYKGGSNLIG